MPETRFNRRRDDLPNSERAAQRLRALARALRDTMTSPDAMPLVQELRQAVSPSDIAAPSEEDTQLDAPARLRLTRGPEPQAARPVARHLTVRVGGAAPMAPETAGRADAATGRFRLTERSILVTLDDPAAAEVAGFSASRFKISHREVVERAFFADGLVLTLRDGARLGVFMAAESVELADLLFEALASDMAISAPAATRSA